MKVFPELKRPPTIAYFTMEIGLASEIPTYSGGLGVLAGDTIKSAADLKLPLVAVTLLYRKGYFRQHIDSNGLQREFPVDWNPAELMRQLPQRIHVPIEGRRVAVAAWHYDVVSLTGGVIPVLFLDTGLSENTPADREISAALYAGDDAYRLKQEVVLGIGGIRMLQQLGLEIRKFHMNEGHAALLTLELLQRHRRPLEGVWDEKLIWDIDAVRERCVFTTHTPVAAGHDKFDYAVVAKVLGDFVPPELLVTLGGSDNLNMTVLALKLSNYVNGVAKKHGEVSRNMFPGYEFNAVTNGVHSYTWTCPSFKKLFDRNLPGWANEPEIFVRMDNVADEEVWSAHMEAKRALLEEIEKREHVQFDPEALTIGFARRATAYKRADLIFSKPETLARIAQQGKIQLVYAGKAHPRDTPGKMLIASIFAHSERLKDDVKIVYLQNYDMNLALKIVAGVDLWLNTPMRPREASGTSGMKAAHNGVPNFSVLDGWWIEGHIENVTGWSIGPVANESTLVEPSDAADAEDLYSKLETIILPTFYQNRSQWLRVMKDAIGKNAYYFNTHRMMRRYATEAYLD